MTARYLVGKYNLCRIGRISKFGIELSVVVNIRKMVKFPLMGTPFPKLKEFTAKNVKHVFQVNASYYNSGLQAAVLQLLTFFPKI